MVKPRLNTIDQVNELIAHGAHAIDVDLVKELLQIIFAQQPSISGKIDIAALMQQAYRPHVIATVAEQEMWAPNLDHVLAQLLEPKFPEHIAAWIP